MGISLNINICQNQPVRSTLSHQGLEPEVTWAWQQLSPTDKSARTREFELQRYEADNTTRLPDQVKKAVLMNETRGPLQQHLHLNAGTAPTYAAMSYYLQSTPSAASKQQPQQRHTGIVSSRRQPAHTYTGNYWRSDGNIAHVIPPKSTTTGPNNSKTGHSRRHCRRQLSKTTEDNSAADGSTAAGSNTRTRQAPTPSVGGHSDNKTWRQGQGSFQRRPTRSRDREDSSREPWVTNTDGLDQEQTTEGMKQEIRSMKAQQVYTELSYNTLTAEQRKQIIKSRWVLRQKGDIVRARIAAKGYTEEVKDNDDIYASTPIFCVLRLLLTMSSQHLESKSRRHLNSLSTRQSNGRSVYVSANRILQPRRPSSVEAQQRYLRSTQQPTRMAETSSRNTTTAWHGKTSKWTKRVQDNSRQRIRPMLRGTSSCGRTVRKHPAAPSTTANRRSHSRQHHQLPAETSPTKVIATRSAYRTNTQPTYYTKQAWQTASHHQRRERRLATQTLNSHSTQRNTEHTDGQSAIYNGWHTPDRTSATQQRS